ncbi:MAG TPA: PEGA domain-containing protein, partial [Candidatus Edwardsbacteria bacterium]|nr:PEGA domain-containing protein [Candidatus Edwardsbacteria bacterium]
WVGILGLAAVLCGCSHHPTYPTYGSIQITSDPPGAEVVIDGQSTKRTTPCKIDGIDVGTHALLLRMWNYGIQRQTISIRSGQTAHASAHLQLIDVHGVINSIYGAADFAYDPVNQRIYVATASTQCLVCAVNDTLVTPLYGIELGCGQHLVAVSPVTGRVFCLLDTGALAMADPASPNALRWLVLPGMAHYRALQVTPDGNTVVAADSANRRLVLVDARLGSVLRSIGLPGAPGDLLFTPSGSELYVLLPPQRRLIKIDLATGTVLRTAATGNDPTGLFWNADGRSIGFCNRGDHSITMVTLANWSAVTAPFNLAATWGSFATPEPDYIFFASTSGLYCCYLPTWKSSYLLSGSFYGSPIRILASRQARRYYMLSSWGVSVIDAHF